ncbi:MAG: MerR family DNA-binding protein [bacterium]
MHDKPLTIGRLAALAGVGVETIRFYERSGLIERPPRRESGYRRYPPESIARVVFVRRAKELGFTLREIRELFSLRVSPECTCAGVRAAAMEKIGDIDAKLDALNSMRGALAALAESCKGDGPISECPILDALDGGGRFSASNTCDSKEIE